MYERDYGAENCQCGNWKCGFAQVCDSCYERNLYGEEERREEEKKEEKKKEEH